MLQPDVCHGPVEPTLPRSAGGKLPGTVQDSEVDRQHKVSSDPPEEIQTGSDRYMEEETIEKLFTLNDLTFQTLFSLKCAFFCLQDSKQTEKYRFGVCLGSECECVVFGKQQLFLFEHTHPRQVCLLPLKATIYLQMQPAMSYRPGFCRTFNSLLSVHLHG